MHIAVHTFIIEEFITHICSGSYRRHVMPGHKSMSLHHWLLTVSYRSRHPIIDSFSQYHFLLSVFSNEFKYSGRKQALLMLVLVLIVQTTRQVRQRVHQNGQLEFSYASTPPIANGLYICKSDLMALAFFNQWSVFNLLLRSHL